MTPKTRTVFRSLSARTNIFISVCRELWEFLEDGERYYEKIVHSFLPALINKWREASSKHVVAIVLFSRVYYDQSELEFAAGPLRKDEDGNWYKDFYKVVVDLEILKDWRPALVTLKKSFLEFQRDIFFNHHYHQNRERPELRHASEDSLRRLVGHLSYAQDAPILEVINLGLNPTDLHYVDRSLALGGSSIIVLTPGPGRFRVSKALLQFTTMRLVDQGYSVDLVCLCKSPLHVSPLFTYESEDPDLLAKDHQMMAGQQRGTGPYLQPMNQPQHRQQVYGSAEMDPLWTNNEKGILYEKRDYHWEPFWMQISWWDVQADMPFRPDRLVLSPLS
ncbi:hypothetical protein DL93DRAFT_2088215 [Clavulina sp. PMI_390]|nr:hypothetical protein DL93DRAFT_2088215 [Clavulina sp. PMI_390]